MKEQEWLEEGWFFHNHAWHLLHEIIKQIPKETKSLLDFGAGTGIAAAIIKAVYPEIECHVTDIEENCMPFWKKRNIYGYIENSLSGFRDESYDIIISSHVLEHIEYPQETIKDMFRVAKKRIIIVVPDGDVHFYDHKIIYNRTVFKNTITEALEGNNFKLNIYPHYHPHINNLVAVIDL